MTYMHWCDYVLLAVNLVQIVAVSGMELVGQKWRFLLGMFFNGAYIVGYILITPFAYAFKDGFHFDLFCAIPVAVFLLTFV